jgi:hydrogenase expression/formation protein HypE
MSKFSLDVLNRCVFPYLKTNDPDVIMGSVFGEDVSLTRVKNGVLVSHLDPIVGAVADIGWLAVHVACNDVATSGTRPQWILLLVLVPSEEDEEMLTQIMRDASRAAEEIGVSVIGGHTGYSSSLSRPLVAVTALGTLTGHEPIRTKGAGIGDRIFVTKSAALEGTAILANDFADTARQLGLSAQDLIEARQLMQHVSLIPEAMILAQHGARAMHDVTRGGLLETLLEMADRSKVCIEVDADRVPVWPVVSRFARAFQFDPLRMISSGTLVAAIPVEQTEAAAKALNENGIHFSNIGRVVTGGGVKYNEGKKTIHYQEIHCEEDELARMWIKYPQSKEKSDG